MKKPHKNQLAFSFGDDDVVVAPLGNDSQVSDRDVSVVGDRQVCSYRDALVQQIARDMETLKFPADMIDPEPQFYLDRIAMYRAACQKEMS